MSKINKTIVNKWLNDGYFKNLNQIIDQKLI